MNAPPLLIAGIGNIFLGDDAFGGEVARLIASRFRHDRVRIVDFGIRGIDLMYALTDDQDGAIIIDLVARGQPAGTLMVIEPNTSAASHESSAAPLQAHSLDPLAVLERVAAMNGRCRRVLIVGCDRGPLEESVDPMRMSPAVRAAIAPAAEMVEGLVNAMLARLDADASPPPVIPDRSSP